MLVSPGTRVILSSLDQYTGAKQNEKFHRLPGSKKAAISAKDFVCVLQKSRKGDFVVADSVQAQGELIKQGYRPA